MTFVRTRHTELEIACSQFDMEGSGWLGLEDLKSAFKQAGLRLTSVGVVAFFLDKTRNILIILAFACDSADGSPCIV